MSHSSYISQFALRVQYFSADIFIMENKNKNPVTRFADFIESRYIKLCADNSKKIFLLFFVLMAVESGIRGLPFIEFWRQFGKSLGVFFLSWSVSLALFLLVRKVFPKLIRVLYTFVFVACAIKILQNVAIVLRHRTHSFQSIVYFSLFVSILTLFELHFREKETD